MGLIVGPVLLQHLLLPGIALRQRPVNQRPGTVSHEAPHLLKGPQRQPVSRQHVVYGVLHIRQGVQQGAVHVKQDRMISAHGRPHPRIRVVRPAWAAACSASFLLWP